MNVLKILTICILIVFPFGELWRISIGNNIVIKPLDVLVGTTGLVWIVWSAYIYFTKGTQREHKSILPPYNKKRYLIFLCAFSVVGLVSLITNLSLLQNNEFIAATMYLVRWTAYAFLFVALSWWDSAFKKTIKTIILVDGFLIVFLGYLQYFFYSSLKNLYYLGWDEHMYRMFSVFLDPNFAGAFFVLYFLFVGGELYQSIETKNKKNTMLYGTLLIATLGSVLLTYSRSALITLLVSSVVFLILINKKKFILALFGSVIVFLLIVSPFFYLENINIFRTASSEARLETAGNAIAIAKDHPVLGIGFNAYRYAQIRYGFRDEKPIIASHADAGVDNSYLFVLVTTGIIGLVIFLCLWFTALFSVYRLATKKKNAFAAVVVSSIVGIMVNALFINSLFYMPLILWIWIIILLLP